MARSPILRAAPPNNTVNRQPTSYSVPANEPQAEAEQNTGIKKSWKDVLSAPRKASTSNGAGNAEAAVAVMSALTENNFNMTSGNNGSEIHLRKEAPLAIITTEGMNGEINKQGAVDLPMKGLCDSLKCDNILQSEAPTMSSSPQMYMNISQNGHAAPHCQNNICMEESELDRAERSRQFSLNAGAAEFSPTASAAGAGLPCPPPPVGSAGMPGYYAGAPGMPPGMYPPQPMPPGSVPMDVMPFYSPMAGSPPVTFYGGSYGFQV
jgi:hypothetical protein